MEIEVLPLTAEEFAPFGEVFAAPATPGRIYSEGALANARAGARPSLSVALREAAPPGPVVATVMERHAFSSQSFVPMGPGRFLVLVAPHGATGGPDMTRARAFVAWDEGVLRNVRIALASSAPVTLRARRAEALLEGKPLSEALIDEAGAIACEESAPRSSWRASREHRLALVSALTRRAVRRACDKAMACEGAST